MIHLEQNANPDLRWYAIQVEARLGGLASTTLRSKGYQEFLPLYRARRRWSDRVKEISLPLFPGYLFCRFDVRDRLLPILTTPGVISIVAAGKTPAPVHEVEIENIRTVLSAGQAAQPWPFLSAGQRVYIERGPLAGLEGIISEADKSYRLVISVHLLQRSVAVEIDREWARPVSQTACGCLAQRGEASYGSLPSRCSVASEPTRRSRLSPAAYG